MAEKVNLATKDEPTKDRSNFDKAVEASESLSKEEKLILVERLLSTIADNK